MGTEGKGGTNSTALIQAHVWRTDYTVPNVGPTGKSIVAWNQNMSGTGIQPVGLYGSRQPDKDVAIDPRWGWGGGGGKLNHVGFKNPVGGGGVGFTKNCL